MVKVYIAIQGSASVCTRLGKRGGGAEREREKEGEREKLALLFSLHSSKSNTVRSTCALLSLRTVSTSEVVTLKTTFQSLTLSIWGWNKRWPALPSPQYILFFNSHIWQKIKKRNLQCASSPICNVFGPSFSYGYTGSNLYVTDSIIKITRPCMAQETLLITKGL